MSRALKECVCIQYTKDQQTHFNFFGELLSYCGKQTCLGHSCGHLQGDIIWFLILCSDSDTFQLQLCSCSRRNHPEDGHVIGRNMLLTNTVGYARTNVIGSRISFVIASVRSSVH